jgi:hypothetical protein
MLLQSSQDQEGKISSLYDSSNVIASKYDPSSRKFVIIFNNGGQYLYEDVTTHTFDEFQKAKSQGSAVHSIIKRHHSKKVGVVDVETIINDINKLKNESK